VLESRGIVSVEQKFNASHFLYLIVVCRFVQNQAQSGSASTKAFEDNPERRGLPLFLHLAQLGYRTISDEDNGHFFPPWEQTP
jgi:hypothetical protein